MKIVAVIDQEDVIWKGLRYLGLFAPEESRAPPATAFADFPALSERRDRVHAIECKWKPEAFETRNLAVFRAAYPRGRNFVVSPLTGPGYERTAGGFQVEYVTPRELRLALNAR